jgi:hypothetical protein
MDLRTPGELPVNRSCLTQTARGGQALAPAPAAFQAACIGTLLLAVAGCVSARPHSVPQGNSIAGTYDIRLCVQPCDPSHSDSTTLRGQLVLEDDPYRLSELPYSVRIYLQWREPYLIYTAEREPNACFTFGERRGRWTLAGISRAAVTRWRPENGSMELLFFQSPDAASVARVSVRGRELHGYAISLGGGARQPFPRDSIWGRRVGPPDRALCVRAIEEKAEAEARRRELLHSHGNPSPSPPVPQPE